MNNVFVKVLLPSRFGSVVAHPDLDGEVSSPGQTKDFKNGTYLLLLLSLYCS